MRRFVLDANIVLAALAGRAGAPPALLLTGVHNGDLDAVACPLLIEEIRENLGNPYSRARITEQEAAEAVEAYEAVCVMFADPADTTPVLRDPEDDYLPALALTSGARAIITGDRDLLDHAGLRPPAIDARTACELTRLLERR